MSGEIELVCVGGPCDGRRVVVKTNDDGKPERSHVEISRSKAEFPWQFFGTELARPVPFERHVYRVQSVEFSAAPEFPVWVLVWDAPEANTAALDLRDLFARLLRHYHPEVQ